MLSSAIPARLEFRCGHAALVSLPRLKGESPARRTERVNSEKAGARGRACDFCGPREHTVVEVLPAQPAGASGGSNGHARVDGSRQLEHAAQARSMTKIAAEHSSSRPADGPISAPAASVAQPAAPEVLTLPSTSAPAASATEVLTPANTSAPAASATARPVAPADPAPARQAEPAALAVDASVAPAAGVVDGSVGPSAPVTARPKTSAAAVVDGSVGPSAPVAARQKTSAAGGVDGSVGPSEPVASRAAVTAVTAVAAETAMTGHRLGRSSAPAPAPTRRRRAPVASYGAAPRARATSTPDPTRSKRTQMPPAQGARPRFEVRFTAQTVVQASDIRAALRQLEALGATAIVSIVLQDG